MLRSQPVDRAPFVTIRCPACGSTDVASRGAQQYGCRHCGSSFLYTGAPQQPQQPPPTVLRRRTTVPGAGAKIGLAVGGVAVVGALASTLMLATAPSGSHHAASMPVATAPTATIASSPATRPVPAIASQGPNPAIAATPVAPEPMPTPEVEPTPAQVPLVLADFQRLRGCSCAGKPAIDLYARATGRSTTLTGAGVRTTRNLEFVLARGDEPPWLLPATEQSAPASGYDVDTVAIAIGCRDDLVVIAAGTAVSAWSLATHALAWSTALPGPFGRFEGQGAELELDCERLRLGKDRVELRTQGGRVRVALRDGSSG